MEAEATLTVFVDDVEKRLKRSTAPNMIVCHMWADSLPELLAMADKLALPRHYLQGPPKRSRTFFYVHKGMRRRAIELGAQEVKTCATK